ncbi:hypothetical protein CJ305_02460 [Leeuwenhoekiella nanhaiensis]|uniref:Uncharacterized protein n=2 Tax=Leeuwenhoekiella nanhaiensis TaxID=1655491 RepID=A0A2G1VWE0_9FLAO|nr:hypothetical protein CJ305_02460 [Leeuwenhoekiella nanhaiensis]
MNFLEMFSLLTGLFFWNKFKGSAIPWFILFLGYNFLNEVFAAFFYIYKLVDTNIVFYNIRFLIYFVLLFLLYNSQLRQSGFKKATLAFIGLWLFSYIYFIIASDFWFQFAVLPAISGGFLLMIVILFYLIEIINKSSLLSIKSNLYLYISLGLLLEAVVQLPVFITWFLGWTQVTEISDARNAFFNSLRQVSYAASCVMYIIFIYGFYKSKPQEVKS